MMNSREDMLDVKRESTQYMSHEITDTELIVSWVLGNKIDMGDKVFNLQDFYSWCKDNCLDRKMWTKTEHVHFEGDDFMTETVFDIEGYYEANKEMLAKEYFDLKK